MERGVRLKGIKRITSKGRVYIYRTVRGKMVRLPDLPENHPEFLQAYLDAENLTPTDASLSALVECFIASRDFQRRKDTTRAVWRRRLDQIKIQYGKAPVAKLETQHINKALRKLTPGAARSERTIWRALMAFAVQEGWRYDNPAKDAYTATQKAAPHVAWSPSEIAAYRAHWPIGTPERQGMEVLFWTGARCVDAVAIGWQNVKNGYLEFEQEKTGGVAVVPITADVDHWLEKDRKLFLSAVSPEMLFITVGKTRARSVKGLSNLISKAARASGLVKRTAHGLRKSRAIALVEAGWTPSEIGAWTGHESLQEISHYTRDANKRALVSVKQTGKLAPDDLQVIENKDKI